LGKGRLGNANDTKGEGQNQKGKTLRHRTIQHNSESISASLDDAVPERQKCMNHITDSRTRGLSPLPVMYRSEKGYKF